ncbi:hypothetical protein ACHAWF_010449 [Thalassiosira exigua]
MEMESSSSPVSPVSSQISAVAPLSFHRSDPLDIPHIDEHLLTRLLLPRLASAISLAFPRAHLDWTTGVVASPSGVGGGGGGDDGGGTGDALAWKRVAEGTLRLCLLLGSCRLLAGNGGAADARVTTPAMRSLGMMLRPSSDRTSRGHGPKSDGAFRSRARLYGKIAALAFATVVVPGLLEELKYRRGRQLEEREQRSRLEEIRREMRPRSSDESAGRSWQQQQQQQQQSPRSPLDEMQRRARKRRSLLRSLLADAALGFSEVVLPPLRLICYVSYLWGMSPAPGLGVRLSGWEYAPAEALTLRDAGESAVVPPYQRHANFQYGNRRLLVEEALRTASMVLPPRGSTGAGPVGRDAANERANENDVNRTYSRSGLGGRENGLGSAAQVPPRGRRRWMQRRLLSFMGVVPEEEDESDDDVCGGGDMRPGEIPLPCSLCGAERPVVPYVASCGHGYCYLCLRAAVTDDLGFRCVRCGRAVASSGRPRPPVRLARDRRP